MQCSKKLTNGQNMNKTSMNMEHKAIFPLKQIFGSELSDQKNFKMAPAENILLLYHITPLLASFHFSKETFHILPSTIDL